MTRPEPCPEGRGCVPRWGILSLLGVVVAVSAFVLYTLAAVWPEALPAGAAERPDREIAFLGARLNLSDDARLFAIVGLAGALGGMVHALRSLSWYVGNRDLRWSWVPFYFLLPIVGATAATIFYVVLRAGLFSPTTSGEETNPYGFAAVAALVGLFSEQAMEKLREVFSSILAPAPAGANTVRADEGEAPPGKARRRDPETP